MINELNDVINCKQKIGNMYNVMCGFYVNFLYI